MKQKQAEMRRDPDGVAPRAGAWIETLKQKKCSSFGACRPPRGGVD